MSLATRMSVVSDSELDLWGEGTEKDVSLKQIMKSVGKNSCFVLVYF